MKKVLVTGSNGQLGKCLRNIAKQNNNLYFVFLTREELDIQSEEDVSECLRKNSFSYCINTAAYTNVESAEENKEKAFSINAEAVKNLAKSCRNNNVTLIHISTDYVFDGMKGKSYLEDDEVNPINVYGASKLLGEKYVQENCPRYYIVRTSWLYSQYGKNFFTTLQNFLKEEKSLKITTEQTGTPTNANDLAKALITIISKDTEQYGIYHYANFGEATWFDFAKAIAENGLTFKKNLVERTDHYPTKAKRPEFSVLDSGKFEKVFSEKIMDWKESLIHLVSDKTLN